MTATTTILIATGNSGKLREIQAVMADLPVIFKSLADFPKFPPAVEDAETFAENAAQKATHYSRLTGLWTLTDDSGLTVDALHGAPGIHSARYAGQPTNTAANNAKLIDALQDVPPELRTARFRCAVALADGDRILAEASGVLEGRIVDQPLGHNGFGFDPHFWVPEFGMTTAQMPAEQKNRISHRGRALAALKPQIARLLPPA